MRTGNDKNETVAAAATHSLQLTNRETLALDGINDVVSFDDSCLLLQSALGLLTIDGEELHIVKLSVESGELIVAGKICGIYYVDRTVKKSGGFFGKKSSK